MPVDLILEALGGELIDIDEEATVNALAKRFKVSQAAMRFRLGNVFAWE